MSGLSEPSSRYHQPPANTKLSPPHLAVVSLFYGTLGMVYLQPLKTHSMKDSVATVMYAVVTPMMNPFIYSLRNKDFKRALCRFLNKTI